MIQKRNIDTKKNIKKAFIKLIAKKGLDKLTVSDISREAGINRGTFYLHYLDKYNLMESLETEIIQDLEAIMLRNAEPEHPDNPIELLPYNVICSALTYVKHDFAFIQALLGEGGDSKFADRVKGVINEMIESKIKESKILHFSKKELPEDYAKEILLSSIVAVILLWIKKGAAEAPEEIAGMITKAKQISPYELLI